MSSGENAKTLTEDEIRDIVQAAVTETLSSLGLEGDRRAMMLDFLHLRKTRVGSEQTIMWTKRSAVGLAVAGVVYAIFEGVKASLKL